MPLVRGTRDEVLKTIFYFFREEKQSVSLKLPEIEWRVPYIHAACTILCQRCPPHTIDFPASMEASPSPDGCL